MEGVTFGKRLKDLRSSRGMSQRELSEIIGVSKSSVNMYELDKREPGFSTLTSIADVFNVSVDYLLGHAERETRIQEPSKCIAAEFATLYSTTQTRPLIVRDPTKPQSRSPVRGIYPRLRTGAAIP